MGLGVSDLTGRPINHTTFIGIRATYLNLHTYTTLCVLTKAVNYSAKSNSHILKLISSLSLAELFNSKYLEMHQTLGRIHQVHITSERQENQTFEGILLPTSP